MQLDIIVPCLLLVVHRLRDCAPISAAPVTSLGPGGAPPLRNDQEHHHAEAAYRDGHRHAAATRLAGSDRLLNAPAGLLVSTGEVSGSDWARRRPVALPQFLLE